MKIVASLFRAVQYAWATLLFSIKQVIAQRGMTLTLLLGLVAVASITMSVPIYADAVYQSILEAQVTGDSETGTGYQRPPFAFMFRYIGSWSGPVSYAATMNADNYLASAAVEHLGLPLNLFTRYYKTTGMRLFTREDSRYEGPHQSLAFISFGTLTGLEDHIILLEGRHPSAQLVDGSVEVLVSESLASELGLQPGEVYDVFEKVQTTQGEIRVEIPISVAGTWKPVDPLDPYWFYNVLEFDSVLFVHPDVFAQHALPALSNEVDLALWYLVMDGSHVKSSDVGKVVSRILYTRQRAFNLLPGLRLDISPLDRLIEFQQKSRDLTLFLYSFSVPLFGMILTFISLVSTMAVQQRRVQIATLRSRGVTYGQMFGTAAFEGSFLGLSALILGLPGAFLIAYFISQTRGFLDFTAGSSLVMRFPDTTWQIGIGMLATAIVAQILPVLNASRYTIVSYKQERSRQSRPAWWQRAWLDVFLLIPVGYGIYLLGKPGGSLAGMPNDPFQNPLLLLLPTLAIFGLTLFLLRMLPWVMKGFAWLASKMHGVSFLLVTRQLARMGNDYHAPMILLVLTLSLSTFTSSMAQTLDRYLYDKNYYAVGADVSLDETGEINTEVLQAMAEIGKGGEQPEATPVTDEPRWFFLPVSEHLKVPGINHAARVRLTQARIELASRTVQGTYMGIDRIDFARVSYWRDDFAPEPLGGLMNDLALAMEGVLVPRSLLKENMLLLGDIVKVNIYLFEERHDLNLRIVGVFDLFPTWDPEEGPLIVGNLDYLYEKAGLEFHYDVWLETKPGADYPRIVDDLEKLGFIVLYYRTAEERLNAEQLRPERQGLFGLLSIGFLALAFLTVLGFFLYALFSFRSRFIELGMLRALGLSVKQMVFYLVAELAFLLLIGLGAGTGLGVWASHQFIPMLQSGSSPEAQLPPFIIHIDWFSVFRIYILFGVLFIIALSTLSALLLRMKIFQAIKMGEMA